MIRDLFFFSIKNLRHRKLRAYLTMIGIFIGISAIISLISMGQGLQNAINKEFETIGRDRIIVSAGGIFMGPTNTDINTAQLTEDDLKVIKSVRGVDYAIELLSKNAKIEFDDEVKYLNVFGIPTDAEAQRAIKTINFFNIREGRDLLSMDNDKVILGHNVAYETFDRDLTLRQRILISDESFDIVGIQKKAGTGVHDVILRIPIENARELFDEPEKISTVFVKVLEGYNTNEVADRIEEKLRESRDVKEGQEDFIVQTSQQTISQLNTFLGIVQIVLIGIASISLLVGGIGIMNTMYTSVLERTREIGIMKSVGATNNQITLIFLIESGLLGTIGGLIGIVLGLIISLTAEVIAGLYGYEIFEVYVTPTLVFGTLLFSFLVGASSGVLPARQAAKLKPVEALSK